MVSAACSRTSARAHWSGRLWRRKRRAVRRPSFGSNVLSARVHAGLDGRTALESRGRDFARPYRQSRSRSMPSALPSREYVRGARQPSAAPRRPRPRRVTYVELFFDLVFVFAVTQLSHGLLEHLTPLGAVQTGAADAGGVVGLDRHRVDHQLARSRAAPPVRLMLFALMLAGLVLSASIPQGVRGRAALAFAIAYASCRSAAACSCCGRSKRHDAGNFRNFRPHPPLAAPPASLWIAGGLAEGPAAADVVGCRGRHRIPSRRWSASGCRASAARPPPTGRSTAATWPSAAACSSSSRLANRCWSPARPSPACPGPRNTSARSWWRSSAASRCG